jgi:TonB family protein
MNPNGFDEILFRGIPPAPNRGPKSFLTSLVLHAMVVGLVLVLAPAIVLQEAAPRFSLTLVAPVESKPVESKPAPKPVQTAKVEKPAEPVRALRPLARPQESRITPPKLEPAPALPSPVRPAPVLPAESVAIRPPVQTGVFGANTTPKPNAKLPVATAKDAGFDRANSQGAIVPESPVPAAAGFDVRSGDSQATPHKATIQTGAFAETRADARATRLVAANVARGGFDAAPEQQKAAAGDQTVRKTGFDEPKPSSTPVKQAAPAPAAIRPLAILDKPKPVYTAEARAQKIEGDVLLDVIFTAAGEVRVLRVVRGLGHGLDENAVDAARRIRFTPAMQSGTPVDQHVVLHVVFQITG